MKTRLLLVLIAVTFGNTASALDAFSRDDRKKEATSLRTWIARIDQHIPNLSPDAKAFIATEQQQIDKIEDEKVRLKRVVALYETKEMQLSRVKSLCMEGLRALDYILSDAVTEEEEVLGWLSFVMLFMDPAMLSDGLATLERAGTLSKEDIESMVLMGSRSSYGRPLARRAKSIMEEIILPLYSRRLERPNKAPEPTPTSVMPRANERKSE